MPVRHPGTLFPGAEGRLLRMRAFALCLGSSRIALGPYTTLQTNKRKEEVLNMEKKRASFTATLMAYYRAYHVMHETPKIFDDFLACRLVTEKERAAIEYQIAESLKLYDLARAASCPDQATALQWMMREALAAPSLILARSRYAEDSLKNVVRQGVRQYVILGAGMDTFAFRRPGMLERLQVFEVDHPATQALKYQRITEAGWEQPAQLHFVPVDFEKESLAEVLMRSSYDPQSLSFFSWLGVTYYLTRDAIFATLRAIADISPPGSMVVFDYMDNDAFVPGRIARRVDMIQKSARQMGEPMITGFDPPSLAAELTSIGLRVSEDLSPADIQERYFQGRTDGYHACEHQHFAWVVVE